MKRENGSSVTHRGKGNDVTSRPAHATTCKRVLFLRLPSDGDKELSHADGRREHLQRLGDAEGAGFCSEREVTVPVVEHCVSSTKGCGFDSQGTRMQINNVL